MNNQNKDISASVQVDTVIAKDRVTLIPELPTGESQFSLEKVYKYLGQRRARMKMLVEDALMDRVERKTVIDQVFIEKLDDGSGMIWGMGLGLTNSETLPTAPLMFSLKVSREGVASWEEKVKNQSASEAMRKEVWERLFAPEAKGKYFVDVHGWGETVDNRMPDIKEVHQGLEEGGSNDWVGIAVSPYGALGTVDTANIPEARDVVGQVKGVIESLGSDLAKEFGERNFDSSEVWKNLGGGIGHSMGGWTMANLAYELRESLDKCGNHTVKWVLENPVIYGAQFSDEMKAKVEEFFGKGDWNPNHVQLLKNIWFGKLVELSPYLMKNRVIRKLSEKLPIMEAVVGYYLAAAGKEYSKWKGLNQQWSAKNDPKYIEMCNKLLIEMPCIVSSQDQFEALVKLGKLGQLVFAIGDHDRVLTPKEQKRVAEALGAKILLETGSHSPKEKQGVEVGRYFCNVF
ncbi:hypothetical protein KBD75_01895 [Candidatus Woesebacteria bacterium]|nr:hypothetical protein [Candidatus Woesebacteria bacterium]